MSWVCALAILTWAAEPVQVAPTDAGSPAASGSKRGPLHDKRLQRTVRRVASLVERLSGRQFLVPPVVELATEQAFGVMLREESALINRAVHRDTAPELRERIVREAHQGILPGLLGKYGVFEDKLFLVAENLREVATELGESEADVVTLVLAHELVHALHDQHADLASLVARLPDRDALWALMATSEGLANWVEGRLADELGLGAVHEEMNRLQGWTEEGPLNPESFEIWSRYGLGSRMIAHHFAEGGLERVWAVALAPPSLTRGLFRPETWPSHRAPPALDYASVLRGTEQLVTRGDWLVAISVLGEGPLFAEAYGAGDPARVDAVIGHIEEAWLLEAVRPDRQAQIRIVVFDGPDGPKDYLALLRDHDEGLADRLGTRLLREVDVTTEPFEQVDGDVAARRTSMVEGLAGTRLERHSAWVVRGDTLVVVLTESFRPGLRLGWTIDSVFARLQAARRGEPLPPPRRP